MIRLLLVVALLLGAPVPAARAALLQGHVVSGQLKTLNLAYAKAPVSPLQDGFFSASSLRLELQGKLGESFELEFAVDSLLLYSDPPEQLGLPIDSANRRLDLEQSWNRGGYWSNQSGIDRLSIKGSLADFDWQAGRQAIGFGRIALFSPLDVVAPFAPTALDTDIRLGVDALHGVGYFGLGGQLGGTLVFGDAEDQNSYLLSFSANHRGIDLLGIGGSLRERQLIGLGLAGSLGPLGVKGEISHYSGKHSGQPGGDLWDDFEIAAIELWYRFDRGLVLLAEYLYNGAGATDPADYPAAARAATVSEGLSFLLGRQYLLLGPSWELHPLVTLSGLLIRNLADDSTLLRPQIQLSLGDNLSLDLFYALNFGKSPQPLTPALAVPRSEFGAVGDSGGLLLRWYF